MGISKSINSKNARFSLVGCYTRYSCKQLHYLSVLVNVGPEADKDESIAWTARVVAILEYYDIPYTAIYFNLSPESKAEVLTQLHFNACLSDLIHTVAAT